MLTLALTTSYDASDWDSADADIAAVKATAVRRGLLASPGGPR